MRDQECERACMGRMECRREKGGGPWKTHRHSFRNKKALIGQVSLDGRVCAYIYIYIYIYIDTERERERIISTRICRHSPSFPLTPLWHVLSFGDASGDNRHI